MTRAGGAPLALPLTLSLALHAGAVALLLFAPSSSETMQVQPFMAHLIAAPAGPRQEGVVVTPPVKVAPKPTVKAAPVRSKTPEVVKVPVKTNARAAAPPKKETATIDPAKSNSANAAKPTPDSKAATPQIAGGGPVGSTGADVANVLFNGLEFPDQRYLHNIVGKIAKHFKPLDNFALVAELSFDINREGCIQNLKVVKGSNVSAFDLEAKVAITKAGENCGFTPLPAVWTDDILSIRFKFDPRFIK